jgi:hypothetical protein
MVTVARHKGINVRCKNIAVRINGTSSPGESSQRSITCPSPSPTSVRNDPGLGTSPCPLAFPAPLLYPLPLPESLPRFAGACSTPAFSLPGLKQQKSECEDATMLVGGWINPTLLSQTSRTQTKTARRTPVQKPSRVGKAEVVGERP